MTNPCLTLRSLLALGFERRPPEYVADIVGFRFRFLDLKAWRGVNRYFCEVVFLGGVLDTGRTIAEVQGEIPPDLQDERTTAAWVAMALGSLCRDLQPLPAWLEQGIRDRGLVKLRLGTPASPEAKRVASCRVDRDQARVLRRNLRATVDHGDDTEMLFSFDGHVLSIALADQVYRVVASGQQWMDGYCVTTSPDQALPARFPHPQVDVVVYDGFLRFGSRLLKM